MRNFVPALKLGPNSVSVEQGADGLIVRVWRRDGAVVTELKNHRMLVPWTRLADAETYMDRPHPTRKEAQ